MVKKVEYNTKNDAQNQSEISDDDKKIVNQMMKHFKYAKEYYAEQRVKAQEDFDFRNGNQWDVEDLRYRKIDGRPCLTINKLKQFVAQVVNNQKINRPSINVTAVDDKADVEISEVFEGIIKHIENQSFAENAYDVSFENAVTCGEGYIRIVTKYDDKFSFDQDIYIEPIDNIFNVYVDPDTKSDFTDIKWAMIFEDLTLEQFKEQYPNSSYTKSSGWLNEIKDGWLTEDTIRVCEYFYIEEEEVDICLLKGGQIIKKDLLKQLDGEHEVVKERTTTQNKVCWIKSNGIEVLEKTTFPGDFIPVVPVYAETYINRGKRQFEGVIRQAKEAQKAYNYWVSAETELIALSPKAPFIGVEGQFEGHEEEWQQANVRNYPFLQYKNVGLNGVPCQPPMRAQFDPQINSIIEAKQSSDNDLKSITGVYDPALGSDKKEASGIAILTRQRQIETTNFMYIDNLSKSLKQLGRILLNIIPKVYDTQRMIRISGDVNEDDKIIQLNHHQDAIYLDVGKYDVEISIGPYGENQRQQAIESMLSLMQINPDASNLMLDIFVGKQDWEGAREISNRLKLLLPPQLQQQNGQNIPPEVQAQIAQAQQQYEAQIQQDQAQMQQMQALIAQLTAELNKTKAESENRTAELASKERIAAMNARTQLLIAEHKEMSTNDRLAFEKQLEITAQIQSQQVEEPLQSDVYVIPGVNDPVTLSQKQSQDNQEMSDEEKQILLNKIDNHIKNSTKM